MLDVGVLEVGGVGSWEIECFSKGILGSELQLAFSFHTYTSIFSKIT
jgi:hypothetical protein